MELLATERTVLPILRVALHFAISIGIAVLLTRCTRVNGRGLLFGYACAGVGVAFCIAISTAYIPRYSDYYLGNRVILSFSLLPNLNFTRTNWPREAIPGLLLFTFAPAYFAFLAARFANLRR